MWMRLSRTAVTLGRYSNGCRLFPGKMADTIGEGLIDIYAVVDGGIVAANPWEGDLDDDFRQSEWYTEAIQADGELVCGRSVHRRHY